MMTEDEKLTAGDDGLEAYFTAARADAPVPSAALMGRIMADAVAQNAPPKAISARPGMFASLIEAIGGWPTLAGMATAGIVGVWVGFSQPAGLDAVTDQWLGVDDTSYLVDLMPAFGAEIEEG